jgi:hypothetical protein
LYTLLRAGGIEAAAFGYAVADLVGEGQSRVCDRLAVVEDVQIELGSTSRGVWVKDHVDIEIERLAGAVRWIEQGDDRLRVKLQNRVRFEMIDGVVQTPDEDDVAHVKSLRSGAGRKWLGGVDRFLGK